jgi:hypothetical protein
MTTYRITPRNYTGLTNLDSGDAPGDVFFGLYELAIPEFCKGSQTSHLPQCQNIPILSIPNFNVYEQFTVEYDTRFGHYNECNPDPDTGIFRCVPQQHSRTPTCWYDNPQWKIDFADDCSMSQCTCETVDHKSVGMEPLPFGGHMPPPNWPSQCAGKYSSLGQVALNVSKPSRITVQKDVGACCTACTDFKFGFFSCRAYTFYEETGECQLFVNPKGTKAASSAQSGYNAGGSGGSSLFTLISNFAAEMNGTWFSTQAPGECQEGQTVGVDCFWKMVEMKRNVNATCVNGNVVEKVIARNSTCWDGCGADAQNMTSSCWINCLFNVLSGNDQTNPPMSREEVLAPFEASFATDDPSQGGCPTIPACPPPCKPPTGGDDDVPAVAPYVRNYRMPTPDEILAILAGPSLNNCNPVAWDFCCEVGTKCDCSKGITAPGQCKTDSYDFCCGVGKVCDCTTPPNASAPAIEVV